MIIRVIITLTAIVLTAIYAIVETVSQDIPQRADKVVDLESDRVFIYQSNQKINYSTEDLECLTRNIFFEAGVENRLGKYAVGQVTLNRLNHGYWGKTICSVVYSKDQFSWTKSRRLRTAKVEGQNWEDSYRVAQSMLHGMRIKNLETALFYHADYVNPFWKHQDSEIGQVGRHIFYAQAEGSWLKVLEEK